MVSLSRMKLLKYLVDPKGEVLFLLVSLVSIAPQMEVKSVFWWHRSCLPLVNRVCVAHVCSWSWNLCSSWQRVKKWSISLSQLQSFYTGMMQGEKIKADTISENQELQCCFLLQLHLCRAQHKQSSLPRGLDSLQCNRRNITTSTRYFCQREAW